MRIECEPYLMPIFIEEGLWQLNWIRIYNCISKSSTIKSE